MSFATNLLFNNSKKKIPFTNDLTFSFFDDRTSTSYASFRFLFGISCLKFFLSYQTSYYNPYLRIRLQLVHEKEKNEQALSLYIIKNVFILDRDPGSFASKIILTRKPALRETSLLRV